MKKLNYFAAVSSVALITFGGFPASAQQMDYASLESLFEEPVTTSATGKPQRISEAPVNMEIVTAEDIRRMGARSVPEALKNITGVDVWQKGIGDFDVGIRGSNSYYNPTVLVMINGRQVYVDDYGYMSWESIPVSMSEIRQIEVVKGPNSALFGFNAVAGVVNIITINPKFYKVDNVNVTVGSGPDYRASVAKTFSIGEGSAVRISATRTSANDFNGQGLVAMDNRETGLGGRSVNIDGRFDLGNKTTLALGASHDINHANEMNPWDFYANTKYETNSVSAGLTCETENWGVIDVSAYMNALGAEISSYAMSGVDVINKISVVKAQDLFKVGSNHTFRVAGEYRTTTMETIPDGTGNVAYDVFSASGMWDWSVLDNLSWTNAVRVDKLFLDRSGTFSSGMPYSESDYNRSLTAYSANSGLVYKVTDRDTLGISYGRGIQIPSLTNLGGIDSSMGPLYVGGRPDLNPTVATNYELDYTRTIPEANIGGSVVGATFKAALFHKKFQDLIAMMDKFSYPYMSPFIYLADNVGSSQSTGLELSLKGKIDSEWHWGANYTYETTKDSITSRNGDPIAYAGFSSSSPRHMANLNLGYNKGPWEVDGNLHYVSARTMPRDTTPLVAFDATSISVDPVYGIDARIGYKLTDNVTLSLSGSNLQSANSHQTSGADVERAVWLGVSWDY